MTKATFVIYEWTKTRDNFTSTTRIITTNVAKDEVTGIVIRPLRESDIAAADRTCRLAFGTFIGLQDPLQFFGDANYIRTRLRADPSAAFAAEVNGELVSSNFVANWGSVGVFGTLTVRPDFWDKGIALNRLWNILQNWVLDILGYLLGHIAQCILDYRDLVFGHASSPQ